MTDTIAQPEVATGTLSILDSSGDTRIAWSSANADEVAHAKATFDKFKAKGYLAYRVEGDGKGSVIRSFDPEAGDIIMSPQLVGG